MNLEQYIKLKSWYEHNPNSLYLDRRGSTMQQFCNAMAWHLEHKLGMTQVYATDIIKSISWGLDDVDGNGSYEKTLHYKFAPMDIDFSAKVRYGKEGDTRFVIIEKV